MVKDLRTLHRSQRGITGLETAIILIAFVVVASVFGYTILSAGIFSADKSKEAISAGLQQARGSMEVVGSVLALDSDDDNDADSIVLTVTNALGGEAIDLTQTTDADADGLLSDEASKSHTMIVNYRDSAQQFSDITWTATQMGRGNSDTILDAGEKFNITISLTALTTVLNQNDTFTLELKPKTGSVIVVKRTMPAVVDQVMDLN